MYHPPNSSSDRLDRRHRSRRSSSKHLLGSVLDNATRDRQVGALLKVEIDLARSLAAFVDAPERKTSPLVFVSFKLHIRKKGKVSNSPDN
jgi:hypothetical protein